jgi:hypothetical protein
MTESMIDPLEDHAEIGRGGVRRDRWGRALLFMKGTKIRAPFTSASSLSDYISNPYALHRWQQRYLARGMGMRPDLAALAAAETYTTGFGQEDTQANRDSGRNLDKIIERALDVAKVYERADWGTAVHKLTEPGQAQLGSVVALPEMKPDVDSWWRETRGITIVATELFVANDEFMAAGTFDHLFDGDDPALAHQIHERTGVDVTGTLLIVDKKTGVIHAPETSVQESVYAGGELYDRDTEERTTFAERFGKPVNQEVAIFAHVPAQRGETHLYPLDLVAGREAARHAVWVRDWQKNALALRPALDTALLTQVRLVRLITHSTSVAEITALWHEYQDVWHDILTEAAQTTIARKGLV